MAPTSGFWVISRLTTFSLRSALYDIRQALSNSFSASDAVIFNGEWDSLKGAKSNQCLGRVSRPSLFNLAYNGVPGKGVRALKTGSPGGHISICRRVRSATLPYLFSAATELYN